MPHKFKSDRQRKAVMAKLKGGARSDIIPIKIFTILPNKKGKIVVKNVRTGKEQTLRKHIKELKKEKGKFIAPNYAITSISDKTKLEEIRHDINQKLNEKGFKVNVIVKNGSVKLSGVRVNDKRIKEKGHNIQRKTFGEGHKRTRALAWDDWVEVNNTVNDVIDSAGVKANVKSLGGKFDIRDKVQGRRSEPQWESLANENVGSQVQPVTRADFILTPEQAKERGIELKKRK